MAQQISEQTKVTLDLKTIGLIVTFTISLATMWFTLKADIAKAMVEPVPEVSKIEFSYKDELTRATVRIGYLFSQRSHNNLLQSQ